MKDENLLAKILAGLMGVCVGDALGVPVEFTSRSERLDFPVTTLQGYGTHNQPPGTWSDDSSLTFCLVESLCQKTLIGNFLELTSDYFCRWYKEAFWTPYGRVFDIGITTQIAIRNLQREIAPTEAGGKDERSNGNGSLMRVLPLAFCYPLVEFTDLIAIVRQVSCLTHAHRRSQIACGIYISIALALLQGKEPLQAYEEGIQKVQRIYQQLPDNLELTNFQRIMSGKIAALSVDEIRSSGYVIDTLEASLWCFLNSNSYGEAVLKAVNLGDDTDTTSAVTGGLAGIYYGLENIPAEWINQIARKDDIVDLATRFSRAINESYAVLHLN